MEEARSGPDSSVWGHLLGGNRNIFCDESAKLASAEKKKMQFRWGEETRFLALIQRVESLIAKEIPIVLAQHVRVLYWMAFCVLSISFSFKNCRI